MTLRRDRVAHGKEETHFEHGTILWWRAFFRRLWLWLVGRHIPEVKWLYGSRKSEIGHWTEREWGLVKINTYAKNHKTEQIGVLGVQNSVQGRRNPSSTRNIVRQAVESTVGFRLQRGKKKWNREPTPYRGDDGGSSDETSRLLREGQNK